MNQLCKVCGEPAAGFHFGAFTCEGCKSFFGRTYNNISAIAGCKNNGDCVINKKNRTACKACRLRKCLLVGMSKSGSRYGRRSNWFKIHCLLQEQQQSVGPDGGPGGGGSNNNNNFEQLARLHQMQARQTYQDKTNPCIKSASLSPTLSLAAVGLSQQHHQQQQQQQQAATATIQQQHTQQQPNNLPHYLTAAKFFNGVIAAAANCNDTKSAELRLSITPSDSGASSAGDAPDDCHSLTSHGRGSSSSKKHTVRNATVAAISHATDGSENTSYRRGEDAEEQECRRRQLLQIFRSHSEPLKSPFAAFAITGNLPPPILAGAPPPPPALQFLPASMQQNTELHPASEDNGKLSTPTQEQHEPIDLSLKASRETVNQSSRTSSTSSACDENSRSSSVLNNIDVIPRPAPLDLTLVRSQTLTG